MAFTNEAAQSLQNNTTTSNQTTEIKYVPYKSVFEILEETKAKIRDLLKPEVDEGDDDDDMKTEQVNKEIPVP